MIENFKPSYLNLAQTGELAKRAEAAWKSLENCELCPHRCGVNRLKGLKGKCRSLDKPLVASHNIHTGEEPPISGSRGSGTIFFSNCTMKCVFCQNYPISQFGNGKEYEISDLAEMYIDLQKRGAHNINFVTPTHFVPHIIKALIIAIEKGFSLPFVYNTSGYETIETLQLLDGIIDIYLPDIKYSDNAAAQRLSGVADYVEHNRAALKEMFRQVGTLECDEDEIAQRGLIIRHLVLPENLSGSEECINFIAKELSPHIHLALMSQYFPAHKACSMPPMDHRIDPALYKTLTKQVKKLRLNGWIQPI